MIAKFFPSFIPVLTITIFFSGCKKNSTTEDITSSENVIISLSENVISATYTDMASKATELETAIFNFKNNPTPSNLEIARLAWKSTRKAWEQSEGFLFGPVATEDIDPGIDTWPINFADLDSVLASPATLTTNYLLSLTQDALRGFHPLEYLLWGQNGVKQVSEFTPRQMEYIGALATYLKIKTSTIANKWDLNQSSAYIHDFQKAGAGSTVYNSRKNALLEVANAMQGICEEVAEGKIEEPFAAKDPNLEESPYSDNSISDFTDNIQSVKNIYLGTYHTSGIGLGDFVKSYNLSLNAEIITKIDAAISALQKITLPFGQAIFDQPQQIKNAQTAIRTLNETLESKLTPLIQQKVVD
jgi:uncharacterized iron-regulated protein